MLSKGLTRPLSKGSTRPLGQAWLLVPRGSPGVSKRTAAWFVGQLLGRRAECCWRWYPDSWRTLAECLSACGQGFPEWRSQWLGGICLLFLVQLHIGLSTGEVLTAVWAVSNESAIGVFSKTKGLISTETPVIDTCWAWVSHWRSGKKWELPGWELCS